VTGAASSSESLVDRRSQTIREEVRTPATVAPTAWLPIDPEMLSCC